MESVRKKAVSALHRFAFQVNTIKQLFIFEIDFISWTRIALLIILKRFVVVYVTKVCYTILLFAVCHL